MIAAKTWRQADQSVIGLFRAIRADPGTIRRTRPFYRTLLQAIERGIADNQLTPAFQLPPERELSRTLGVSRATIVRAYRELEARGLVRRYVGRGTFVCARPDPGTAPFAWRGKVSARALQFADSTIRDIVGHAANPALVSFAAGQPALECFPVEEFRRAIDGILTRDHGRALRLGPTEGQPRLRGAIAERFGGSPENILVLAGAQQGLDLLARCLVDPGDAVLMDRPGYLGAIGSFRSAGAQLIGWDVESAEIDELEELLIRYRPKLIYVNPTHQNPTGITLPIRKRRDVIALAERYRVPIIEDDTYRELTHGTPPPPSLYELDEMSTVVIHLNSFAKMLAPGLRLGWISAVPAIIEQLTLIKQGVDPNTQNLSQLAVAELLETGAFDRHVARLRGEHRHRRDAMVKALRQHTAPGLLRFTVPDGGLYLWCQVPSHIRAQAVNEEMVRDRMAFVPGEPFYVDRGGAHRLRVCYTAQPPDRAVSFAQSFARSIAAVEKRGTTQPGLMPIA